MKLIRKYIREIIKEALLHEKNLSQLPQYAKHTEMEIYPDLTDPLNPELRDDIFNIIDSSYAYLGGNADIKTADHLADTDRNDYIYFKAWDIDNDPEADVVRGMKPKANQIKLALSATDGSKAAKNFGIEDTARRLQGGGHYAEMSGAAAVVQFKKTVPAVTDPAKVQALLPGKKIIWFGVHPYFASPITLADKGVDLAKLGDVGLEAQKSKQYGPNGEYDGWYVRVLGGVPHAKIILGNV